MNTVFAELARGKGIWRAMLHHAMRSSGFVARPPVADIASGKNPGYWRIMGLRRDAVVTLDSDAAAAPSVVHDVTAPLPWANETFETIFLMNCLYAFPDPLVALKEARRVLRRGGTAAMSFPLVFPYVPEPRDLYRFTEDGIRRLCADAGFASPRIIPVGGRWTAATYLINPFSGRLAFAVIPLYAVAAAFDAVYRFLRPALPPSPIGYFVIVQNP